MRGHPPVGSIVAGYRLVSLVGEGATGSVYLAEREGEPERVALKVLDPELAQNERFRRRFLQESTIAAGLSHAHVVPILDFGETGDGLYLAMRHVDGCDLRELLERDGPLEGARAIDLLSQVADALDVAHAEGLVHRDVKPANILVEPGDRGERVYLGDFGLAKHASSVSSLTGEHAFVGTIAYVSPEQIKGEQIDGRADVYSLGCVLFECLAGAPPFDRESELAVVYAHLNERAPRLGDLRAGLPDQLDDVIAKATAKLPGRRYATCAELIAAARGALAGEGRGSGRRRRVAVALAATAAVAAAVVALVSGGDDDAGPAEKLLAVSGPGVTLVDPGRQRVVDRVALPEPPQDLVFGERSAWALLRSAQRVVELDGDRRRVVGGVELPFPAGGLALAGQALYVTEKGGPGIVRVDTGTRKVTASWTVDTHGARISDPTGIATGAGSVWVARGAEVVRVDPRTGRARSRIPLPVTATLLTFAGGALWAASSENGLVEKIDPASDRVAARAKLHGWISDLAVAGGSVWAAVTPDDVVFRLSADDASVEQTVPAGEGPESLAGSRDALWIANSRGRALTRIDVRSGARRTVALTGVPHLVRNRDGLLWTAATPAPPALPEAEDGGEIRVALRDDGVELDPGLGPYPVASQLLYATCAKLVNYPDAAGAAGRRLRPEAAVALPAISADRRTYSFRIRDDLRFSPPSGRRVDARAFRHTFERTLSPKAGPDPSGLHILGDVAGARAFHAGRAPHVSGITARGDRLTITLEKPAGDLLSRLAMPINCVVPPGTPPPGRVDGPIPSAGPYYVRQETAGQTVLERNPNYRGDRPARPARIVYLTGIPTAEGVALTRAGRADVVPWDYDLHGPLAPGGPLDRRFGGPGGRYREAPAPGVDMIAFNTRRPLFRDARVRRAVNYALDRKALAAVWGEPPTDRYVPPVVSGPRSDPVYPLSGPDLRSARRLLRGRAPASARLYFCGEPSNARIAEIIRANLRPLRIDLAIEPSLDCLQGSDPKALKADLLLVTRSTAELDPAPFLEATVGDADRFGPSHDPVTWDDRGFRKQLERARSVNGDRRLATYERLEDRLLRGPAPYAAFAAFTAPEFRSERAGCALVQGAYQVLDLAALCPRPD